MKLGEYNHLLRKSFRQSFMKIGKKIVDFLLMASFLSVSGFFFTQTLDVMFHLIYSCFFLSNPSETDGQFH